MILWLNWAGRGFANLGRVLNNWAALSEPEIVVGDGGGAFSDFGIASVDMSDVCQVTIHNDCIRIK